MYRPGDASNSVPPSGKPPNQRVQYSAQSAQSQSTPFRVIGTIFILLALIIAGFVLIVVATPTRWKQTYGIVEDVKGENPSRVTLKYYANGKAFRALLEFDGTVRKGDTRDVAYNIESPGSYEHPRLKKSELFLYALLPIALLLIVGIIAYTS